MALKNRLKDLFPTLFPQPGATGPGLTLNNPYFTNPNSANTKPGFGLNVIPDELPFEAKAFGGTPAAAGTTPAQPGEKIPTLAEILAGMPEAESILSPEEAKARIAAARRNLLLGTAGGIFSTLFQSSKTAVPKQDDTFVNRMIRKTPQYLKDYQNQEIDRGVRSGIDSVLSSAPLNQAQNVVNSMVNSGAQAKSAAAVQQGAQDIGLENQYLGAKQQSLDRTNMAQADADNQMITAENQKNANMSALLTNYFNQSNELTQNQNQMYDLLKRDKARMTSSRYRDALQLSLLSRYSGSI